MPRRLLSAAALALAASAAPAPAEDAADLFRALGLPGIVEVMRDEGLAYGETIRDDLFPGRGGAGWEAVVSGVYDAERMAAGLQEGLGSALEGVDLGPLLDFFESPRGVRIVTQEIEARRAMMDDAVEEAARTAAADLPETDPARFALLEAFAEANDLVESNVMGAMNSNYAFYMGLMAGDAFEGTLTETQILSDVWEQEEDIRADTEEWVYSYLALAYSPLSAEDLEAYLALSRTDEGQALNRALFAVFDTVFSDISRRLGEGAARFLSGEDI